MCPFFTSKECAMTIFGVTAAKVDSNGVIEEVTVRQVNAHTNDWIGEPLTIHGNEAASMVLKGEKLIPIFSVNGNTFPGVEFQHRVLPGGHETVALSESTPGRTIQDLMHNVQDQS
jgi:hypothetical protein